MGELTSMLEDVLQMTHLPLFGEFNAIGVDLTNEDGKRNMKFLVMVKVRSRGIRVICHGYATKGDGNKLD